MSPVILKLTLSGFFEFMKRVFLTSCCVAAISATFFVSPSIAVTQGSVPEYSVSFLSDLLARDIRVDSLESAVELYDAGALQAFYEQRENDLFWHSSKGRLNGDARQFVKQIEEAWTHGLNPDGFHLPAIRALMEREGREKAADLDVILTDAFVRYARSFSGMRIAPQVLGVDTKSWLQPYSADDALVFMTSLKSFRDVPTQIIPRSSTYERLRKELKRLVDKGDLHEKVEPLWFGKRNLRPGQYHKTVRVLRERLGVEPQTADETFYDDRLAGAVIAFQTKQGLKPDGILGPQTLHNLNRGDRERALQIIANLERLRWKPEPEVKRFVVVNIPSAMLWAIDDGEVALEMPVVVGKPKRETKIFISNIQGVRINPDWTVPPTVKAEDMLPAVRKNSNFFVERGIKVYTGYGKGHGALDTTQVAWSDVSESDLKSMRLVQPPGRSNPLGQFRVLMPNRYNIYLHDTNSRGQFSSEQRARSSGCVRMSDPKAMADFILQGSSWAPEKLESVMASRKKRDLMIEERIPVYMLYHTIWVDASGTLVYGHDVYGRDEKLIQQLEAIDGFEIPVHNKG